MVPVKISVCRFIIRERLKFRYDNRLKFRYNILAKSTIVLWIIFLMTFGDTLRDGERLASLMEHFPLIIYAKHLSFTFTCNV